MKPKQLAEISVAARFRGPPASGNGGYCSGLLAEFLNGDVIARLNAPVPLERSLKVVASSQGAELMDPVDERVLITARHEPLELVPPPLPPLAQVRAAAGRYWRPAGDEFSGCFGCCQARAPADAIRVLAGRFDDDAVATNERTGMAADLWHANPAFAGPDGSLAPRYVWTVMDCSGALAARHFSPKTILTGAMHIRQQGPLVAGRDYVVLAWPIQAQGRKITTGSVIYDLDGTVLVLGRLIWIVLRDPGS